MQRDPKSPLTNRLPTTITTEQLQQAIVKSGYPLQGFIAEKLRKRFYVREEWSYIDRETMQLRSIDLLAECELFDPENRKLRVRPYLDLILECKRSEAPYVFFLSPAPLALRPTDHVPVLAGLPKNDILVSTNEGQARVLDILTTLSLNGHDFMSLAPSCMTFSKCVRKGKVFELSGSDAFFGLILPLTKAIQHFQVAERPSATLVAPYSDLDLHLALNVAVIDGPIVGVTGTDESSARLMPWIRVFRREYQESDHWWERNRLYAIDAVHKGFFESYLDEQVLPFAEEFGRRVCKHNEILASGEGFVSRLKTGNGTIESRLRVCHQVGKAR